MAAGTDFSTVRVGVDDIRNMIKDRYIFDFQLEPLVDRMKMAMIREVLKAGKDLVVDDIHLTKAGRQVLCATLVGVIPDIEIIYVWMRCDDEVAISRRLTNLRGIPEFGWQQVMKKHKSMFETPLYDECKNIKEIIEVNNE